MMFEGRLGKEMMVQQGYVPSGCTLPDECGGTLIYSEVNAGRDPCAECHHDRSCGGRPRKESVGEEELF